MGTRSFGSPFTGEVFVTFLANVGSRFRSSPLRRSNYLFFFGEEDERARSSTYIEGLPQYIDFYIEAQSNPSIKVINRVSR